MTVLGQRRRADVERCNSNHRGQTLARIDTTAHYPRLLARADAIRLGLSTEPKHLIICVLIQNVCVPPFPVFSVVDCVYGRFNCDAQVTSAAWFLTMLMLLVTSAVGPRPVQMANDPGIWRCVKESYDGRDVPASTRSAWSSPAKFRKA